MVIVFGFRLFGWAVVINELERVVGSCCRSLFNSTFNSEKEALVMWPEIRENLMLLLEAGILLVVWLEYRYDFRKDEEKKHKRTKTTRKTTKGKDSETIEEVTETSEPVDEKPKA